MSRSWDQSGGRLIRELKETLRMHFKGVQTYSLEPGVDAYEVSYSLPMAAIAYGGMLFSEARQSYPVSLGFQPHVMDPSIRLTAKIQGGQALLASPRLYEVPCFEKISLLSFETSMLPTVLPTFSCEAIQLPLPQAGGVTASQLKIQRLKMTQRVTFEKFKKPATYRFPGIKTQAYRLAVFKNPLPIQRKPIPPHRFSQKNRSFFRELLAQKAKIPVLDMQLVSVYDRIFLGLYQSLTFSDEGTLVCVPKPDLDPALRKKDLQPVYLIIGKSLKAQGKTFQVILPMADLTDDS
jgi:hypothetical protein